MNQLLRIQNIRSNDDWVADIRKFILTANPGVHLIHNVRREAQKSRVQMCQSVVIEPRTKALRHTGCVSVYTEGPGWHGMRQTCVKRGLCLLHGSLTHRPVGRPKGRVGAWSFADIVFHCTNGKQELQNESKSLTRFTHNPAFHVSSLFLRSDLSQMHPSPS